MSEWLIENWPWIVGIGAGAAVVGVTAYLLLSRRKVTLRAYGERNDLLAPHLYDLYFVGTNSYVSAPDPIPGARDFAIYTMQMIPSNNYVAAVSFLNNDWNGDWALIYGWERIYFRLIYTDGTYTQVDLGFHGFTPNVWGVLAVSVDMDSGTGLWYNSWTHKQGTFTLPTNKTPRNIVHTVTTGDDSQFSGLPMQEAAVIVFKRPISTDEINTISNNHTVQSSGLAMFLDPTFFNGINYVDISGNNNNGTPMGTVQRVLSNRKWVWRVVGMFSDNMLHVLLPMNVSYTIRGSNGAVLAQGKTTSITDIPLNYSGQLLIDISV